MLNEAVELLFELEEWPNAASVLVEIAPRLIQQGQARGLAEWIDRLPRPTLAATPLLVVWRAHAAYKLQDPDEALRLIDDAVRSLRDAGDMRGLVPALFVRGETQRLKGYYDEALATFSEARALEHSATKTCASGEAPVTSAPLRHHRRSDAAVIELEEARRLLEQVGDLNGISNACNTLAQCYSRRGEPMAALGALQRARSAVERAGNTFDLGLNLNNTGMLYYEMGEYEQALQVYERGLRVVRVRGCKQRSAHAGG
jgi:tetratricopeptide (TPR) repeat protein